MTSKKIHEPEDPSTNLFDLARQTNNIAPRGLTKNVLTREQALDQASDDEEREILLRIYKRDVTES